jgi:hypothetical protein
MNSPIKCSGTNFIFSCKIKNKIFSGNFVARGGGEKEGIRWG